jgi:protein involved in polysaccharide export with SLBB domain/capsular polysaccharide biosynthesis protein
MSDPTELSISDLYKKREDVVAPLPQPEERRGDDRGDRASGQENYRPRQSGGPRMPFETEGREEGPTKLPFDPVRLIDAVTRRWYVWVLTGLIFGGAALSWCYVKTKTMATMQLIRRDAPLDLRANDTGDSYKPQQLSDATLASVIRSPDIYRQVSEQSHISARTLTRNLFATPQQDSQIVDLFYTGHDTPQRAVELLNMYGDEIVRFTRDMQIHDGTETATFLADKLNMVQTNLDDVEKQMMAIPLEQRVMDTDQQTASYLAQLSELNVKYELARIDLESENPVADKLQMAKDELAQLQVRYTDAHPAVQQQMATIKALENELATAIKSAPALDGTDFRPMPTAKNKAQIKQMEEIKALRNSVQHKLDALGHKNLNYVLFKSRYASLQELRATLSGRQREAELYAENALGYFRVFQPASLDHANNAVNWQRGIMLSFAAAFFGMVLAIGFVALVEVVDPRIKTAADLERATGLPVLSTLADLSKMDEAARKAWAFRSWTIIKGKITETQNHSLVCGVISAHKGEGRSTWINLLAETAYQRGLRVLVASTRPAPVPAMHPHEKVTEESALLAQMPTVSPNPTELADDVSQALSPNVFAFPSQATRQLQDQKSHSVVQIPLPGWVWNLERRQQWQAALAEWQRVENLVFLVELPPASQPEGILLAENLPQVIWFAQSGKVSTAETRHHLETLRHAGCHIVGAVLNRAPRSFLQRHFGRWVMGLALIFGLAMTASAQEATNRTSTTPSSAAGPLLSSPKPSQRSAWQEHLTLGPGDIVSLAFYGETNLNENEVVIGTDGRLSYLQANGIVASGLTVDELRDRLNSELGKYYRNPRVMVIPVSYQSKKYYVMGKVTVKGAYVLNRPITIIEALARAHGLESGLVDRNSVDLADLGRSFLIRGGVRQSVDFERLFEQGDFSQNLELQPNDFLYFAPADLKVIYVLGQVKSPGEVAYNNHSSLIGVIAERGGFNDSAWKNRVLVIRGSLNHPEKFAVNTWAILDGRDADFRLQPRDIVYVTNRPFIYAEELLDVGITAFLQSSVTDWEGQNIHIIHAPFAPGL